MSEVFEQKPLKYTPPKLNGGDPFEAIDDLVTTNLSREKVGNRCRNIDWLPDNLKDLIDQYMPNEADIDGLYDLQMGAMTKAP
jgi:hypothetical protein